jgi:hypothetical protein
LETITTFLKNFLKLTLIFIFLEKKIERYANTTLQMHCTENSKQIFPEMQYSANAIHQNRRTDRGNI